MPSPNVLILGSGASAGYAYRACRDAGILPRVMSSEMPDRTRGAFWLRWLPDSVRSEVPKWKIVIEAVGTQEVYLKKQWGERYEPGMDSSFPSRATALQVYNPTLGSKALWEDAQIEFCDLLTDEDILELARGYDLVIQTFSPSFAYTYKPSLGVVWVTSIPVYYNSSDSVGSCIYDGTLTTPWIRRTEAWGEFNLEFGSEDEARAKRFPLDNLKSSGQLAYTDIGIRSYPNLAPGTTPLEPGCLGGNILLTGRFALWDKRELSHYSYARVMNELRYRFNLTALEKPDV